MSRRRLSRWPYVEDVAGLLRTNMPVGSATAKSAKRNQRLKVRLSDTPEKRRQYSQTYRDRHPERARESQRRWRERNVEVDTARWKARNWAKYGVTPEQYEQMMLDQNGVCAICNQSCIRALAVDHDHETGVVRGLLCWKCNTGLGRLEQYLDRAIEYARRPR